MIKPNNKTGQGIEVATELKRIVTTGILAILLLLLAVILDGPVSILAWMLLAAAFLCLMYVVLGSRQLLMYYRSQDHRAERNE